MSLKEKLNIVLDESEETAINIASRNEKKEELVEVVKNFLNKDLDMEETIIEVNHILNI